VTCTIRARWSVYRRKAAMARRPVRPAPETAMALLPPLEMMPLGVGVPMGAEGLPVPTG
jgi:hypothetical protein